MTTEEYFRSVRTLSQEEVDERAKIHDRFTLPPVERFYQNEHHAEYGAGNH